MRIFFIIVSIPLLLVSCNSTTPLGGTNQSISTHTTSTMKGESNSNAGGAGVISQPNISNSSKQIQE